MSQEQVNPVQALYDQVLPKFISRLKDLKETDTSLRAGLQELSEQLAAIRKELVDIRGTIAAINPDIKVKRKRRTRTQIQADELIASLTNDVQQNMIMNGVEETEAFALRIQYTADRKEFMVNDFVLDQERRETVRFMLDENATATEAEVAQQLSVPVAVVCTVSVLHNEINTGIYGALL